MHTLTMKKRVLYITITLLVLAAMPAMSQNVKFDIYFDSLGIDKKEMRIGEQVKLTYELSVDSGYNVQIPSIGKGAAGGIEVLDSALFKSTTVDGRRIYKGEYMVTAFNEAPFVIAPIVARVDSDVYYTNTAHLIVNSVPIDTVNLALESRSFDIKLSNYTHDLNGNVGKYVMFYSSFDKKNTVLSNHVLFLTSLPILYLIIYFFKILFVSLLLALGIALLILGINNRKRKTSTEQAVLWNRWRIV